jgi:hypothetical protein
VHAVAETQDTPLRAPSPPVGLGDCRIAQRLPFQCSANALPEAFPPAPVSTASPTAMQLPGDAHDTAHRWLPGEICRLGVGVASIVHVLPFQRSANVAFLSAKFPGVLGLALSRAPTAVQAVGEAHDTPASSTSGNAPAGGVGVGWIVQTVPFQRSANVSSLPALFV